MSVPVRHLRGALFAVSSQDPLLHVQNVTGYPILRL